MKWSQLAHYDQLIDSLKRPQNLGNDLVAAWRSYFQHEVLVALIVVALLSLSVGLLMRTPVAPDCCGSNSFSSPRSSRRIMSLARLLSSTSNLPQRVHSLDDIVGRHQLAYVPDPGATSGGRVNAVVIGDSTAAGAGDPLLPNATTSDKACRRSANSYAADIAAANHWNVLSLTLPVPTRRLSQVYSGLSRSTEWMCRSATGTAIHQVQICDR